MFNFFQQHRQAIAVSFVALSAFLFAIKAIVVKHAYLLAEKLSSMPNSSGIHEFHLTGELLLTLRMLSCLPFFILMILLSPKSTQPIQPKQWLLLVVAGVVGYYLASILDFIGLQFISASLERVILFLYPTLTVIISSLLYRRPIGCFVWCCIALSYGGTLLVMLCDPQFSVIHSTTLTSTAISPTLMGAGLVFSGAVAYACYLVMSPSLIKTFGSLRFTGLVMVVSTIATVSHYIITTPAPLLQLIETPSQIWYWGIFLGVFATFIPVTLLIQGIKYVGASTSALISASGPVVTVVIAVLFLGEQLTVWQWLGCCLNIIGVVAISFRPTSSQ